MLSGIFLIPNGTFVVELLVFVAIVVLVAKKALPPIMKSLEDRQDKIRTSLEAASRAQEAANEAAQERERVLAEAREQARQIVANAQSLSDQIKDESAGRGKAEYDRLIAAAQGEVSAAKQRAVEEAGSRMSEITFDLVAKIVGREVDQNAHQDLIREAVSALNANVR
ncbi:MAG: F0F1 ATP synthase subunit B [Actinomycetes bacterium]